MNVMTNLAETAPCQPHMAASDTFDFMVIDVETACSRVSSICQVGIVGFSEGREVFAYETLVDPCDEFHGFNIGIHGIGPGHVIGSPTFADIHALVDGHLAGRITVAHSYFDKGALAAACRVHARPLIETKWLDSVRVAKRAWPDLPTHRLNALSRFLGIVHKHHDALSDARAAGMVIVKAIDHTGIDLDGWMAPLRKPGPPPPAAENGPLKGERIAIAGEARDGRLAHIIAAAGGRVVSSVGVSTTRLVTVEQPVPHFTDRTTALIGKAIALQREGRGIVIENERVLMDRIGVD